MNIKNDKNNKTKIDSRLTKLRDLMMSSGIDCYIIPTDDFHSSEYVGDYFKFREYMSGFTGSAGTLAVTENEALLWTDGRYFLQAESEIENTNIRLMKSGMQGVPTLEEWLDASFFNGMTIAYDGRTVNVKQGRKIREAVAGRDVTIRNDVVMSDLIWADRPEISSEPCRVLDIKYSGMSAAQKLSLLRNELDALNADEILLTSPEEISWLYNMRGNDIAYTPVFLSYSIIGKDKAVLYVSGAAINSYVKKYLEDLNIEIRPYFSIYDDIRDYCEGGSKSNVSLFMDPDRVNEALALKVKTPAFGKSPVEMAKSVKNAVEIENMKKAHLMDGVALTKMIYLIKKMTDSGEIYKETELSIEKKLTDLRKNNPSFQELSFASIIATGEHGAIIHYEPTEETNCYIRDGFLLMDTGAHYLEGTTDVTRTVSINANSLTAEMKKYYTAVLKGHLNLMMMKFNRGTPGSFFDEIARKQVNAVGQDYMHGTGHGVGNLLSVHEGPCAFRRKSADHEDSMVGENMIISDEPGIYIEGKYGIRIENLVLCRKEKTQTNKTGMEAENVLGFESLTLAPYDKDAINFDMMTDEELAFLNQYNSALVEKLSPYLSAYELKWLIRECSIDSY